VKRFNCPLPSVLLAISYELIPKPYALCPFRSVLCPPTLRFPGSPFLLLLPSSVFCILSTVLRLLHAVFNLLSTVLCFPDSAFSTYSMDLLGIKEYSFISPDVSDRLITHALLNSEASCTNQSPP